MRVTPDLTYAEYAREGFFQLMIAAALVVPWLLSADWLLGASGAARPSTRSRRMYRSLAAGQLLLLLAIVASALQRMQAYQDAYGLTESRLLATAFLLWVSAIVVWFGGTVLVGRRTRFAFGGLVSGFALLAILHALNPDALIARRNLERAVLSSAEAAGPGSGPQLDLDYLASLGSDAVPALLGGLVELDGASRCRVARRLLRAWGPGVPTDWRSWNWSVERARELIGADAERLRRFAPRGSRCGRGFP